MTTQNTYEVNKELIEQAKECIQCMQIMAIGTPKFAKIKVNGNTVTNILEHIQANVLQKPQQ